MKETHIGSSHLIVTESADEEKKLSDFLNPVAPGPVDPAPSDLPIEGRTVPTFHTMSIYWTPPSPPTGNEVKLEYRKVGGSWNLGHPLWYDSRSKEACGCAIYLDPDTDYEFRFSMPGKAPQARVRGRTRSESFNVGETVRLPNQGSTLRITQGGSPGNYKLYIPESPGGIIDVSNTQLHSVIIEAPYVILDGFKVRGAQGHAISLRNNAHDCVLRRNDISNWGRLRNPQFSNAPWPVANDGDSGIHAYKVDISRLVMEYNYIHDPRHGSNPWDIGHPHGSNAVYFHDSGHNLVVRWNSFVGSSAGDHKKFFMDGFGSADNFGQHGTPGYDSDIYGNYVFGCMDDGLECEGGQKNVRIWNNLMDMCTVAIGSTVVNIGPQYIFRNVWNRGRKLFLKPWDQDQRLYMVKAAAAVAGAKGRRYVYHNTMLQHPPEAGSTLTQGGEQGIGALTNQPLLNTKSRNNVFHIWKPHIQAIRSAGGVEGNSFDYDLYNGTIEAAGSHETHGIKGTPKYKSGHGPTVRGRYQLEPGSPGVDRGEIIPNFNDGFNGAAPDIGVHEEGTADIVFGHNGRGKGAGSKE